MDNKQRLIILNEVVDVISEDYGWGPDLEFSDENRIEDYKDYVIERFSSLFDTSLINEHISPLNQIREI